MKNNLNTIIGGFVAALILIVSSIVTLFAANPELTFDTISQGTWVAILGGGLVAFLKSFNTINVRRLSNKMTHTGDGGGDI